MPSGGGGGGLSNPVTIATGGTGQTTAAAALAALGGAAAGSHTLKRGSAGGNYVVSVTSFAAIDSANLDVTVVVPTGKLAIALLCCSGSQASGSSGEVSIAVDGTTNYYTIQGAPNNGFIPHTAMAVLVGDGASHTFSPNARVQVVGADPLTVANSDAVNTPIHLVLLISAS
jgi:hypothetical protein